MSELTLHEAILAGASAMRAEPGVQYKTQADGSVSGCALGMANVAAGARYVTVITSEPLPEGENHRSHGTSMVWGRWVKRKVDRPCDCQSKTPSEVRADAVRAWNEFLTSETPYYTPSMSPHTWRVLSREMAIEDIIPHLFDNHVACKNPTWTIEQLADWVKSVEEPAREAQMEEDVKRMAEEVKRLTAKLLADTDFKLAPVATPWPSNFSRPWHHVPFDWGKLLGPVDPGNDIFLAKEERSASAARTTPSQPQPQPVPDLVCSPSDAKP